MRCPLASSGGGWIWSGCRRSRKTWYRRWCRPRCSGRALHGSSGTSAAGCARRRPWPLRAGVVSASASASPVRRSGRPIWWGRSPTRVAAHGPASGCARRGRWSASTANCSPMPTPCAASSSCAAPPRNAGAGSRRRRTRCWPPCSSPRRRASTRPSTRWCGASSSSTRSSWWRSTRAARRCGCGRSLAGRWRRASTASNSPP